MRKFKSGMVLNRFYKNFSVGQNVIGKETPRHDIVTPSLLIAQWYSARLRAG
jgi:hypothetical protein